MSKWISVKDRLPTLNDLIMVTWANDYSHDTAYYHPTQKWHLIDYETNEILDDDVQVTHWMPLPKPPEEK